MLAGYVIILTNIFDQTSDRMFRKWLFVMVFTYVWTSINSQQ